ncbi:MAG: hypothetical protein M1820_010478 [Bogoriella megaspora]|nr:MAG: hypothetical protein M1820_010478 [Bogoriella megaspora]
MALPLLTPSEQAQWHDDQRPALYTTLTILLVLNNSVAGGRLVANYYTHYRKERFSFRTIFLEDYFILISTVLIDVVIANLLAATKYGLGLHSWRINSEDSHYPRNLSNTFEHVWIVMVFTGPTFTFIKLTLLYFYRRLFLVNQKWLKRAWWANLVYVILWLFGATGFYVFQCWPVQWYFLRYYEKYSATPPYPIEGQCNATTTTHVAVPLIFGLASDIAILLLPLVTISQLHMERKAKLGLAGVFSIGLLACTLDLVRIIELFIDTDDKNDPSYGVVVFLILSATTEVAGLTCACLPIIVPAAWRAHKHRRDLSYPNLYKYSDHSSNNGPQYSRKSRGFAPLDSPRLTTTIVSGNNDASLDIGGHGQGKDDIPLRGAKDTAPRDDSGDNTGDDGRRPINQPPATRIWIEREIDISTVERG